MDLVVAHTSYFDGKVTDYTCTDCISRYISTADYLVENQLEQVSVKIA